MTSHINAVIKIQSCHLLDDPHPGQIHTSARGSHIYPDLKSSSGTTACSPSLEKKQQSNIEYLYSNSKSHICLLLSFMYRFLQAGGCQARPSRAHSRVSSAAE